VASIVPYLGELKTCTCEVRGGGNALQGREGTGDISFISGAEGCKTLGLKNQERGAVYYSALDFIGTGKHSHPDDRSGTESCRAWNTFTPNHKNNSGDLTPDNKLQTG